MTVDTVSQPVRLEELFAGLRFSPRLIGVLAICVLIALAEGYDVQVMAFAAPSLTQAWGLDPQQIGLLLTASVLGIVLGNIFIAPIGDRIGRRPATLLGLLCCTVFVTAGAFAPDMNILLLVRLIAGLGLGLAIPNVIAIAMEVAPVKARTMAIVAVNCGYPVGAALGGAVASRFVQDHGHAAVFIIGGAATTVMLFLSLLWLPESPAFLAQRPQQHGRLRRVLSGFGIVLPDGAGFVAPPAAPRSTVAALFTRERRVTTLLLWVMNFANMAIVYFFISWLPSLLSYRGLPASQALVATSVFSASGAIGGLLMALVMRRISPPTVLSSAYLVTGLGVVALSILPGSGPIFFGAIAVSGAAILGSLFCLTAVVNHYYPAEIRVGASGYATGIGRLGAVAAPMVGGVVLSVISATEQVFLVTAAPALLALLVAMILRSTGTLARAA